MDGQDRGDLVRRSRQGRPAPAPPANRWREPGLLPNSCPVCLPQVRRQRRQIGRSGCRCRASPGPLSSPYGVARAVVEYSGVLLRPRPDRRQDLVGRPSTARAGPATNTEYEFHADRAEFRRRDGDVETRWAVCVAPDADAEVRAVTLINHGRSAPRSRPDQLRRGLPESPPRRPGPPRLRKAVPGDGVRCRSAAALLARRRPRGRERESGLGDPSSATGRRGRADALGTIGPRAIPRARPYPGQSRRPGPRRAPFSRTTGPVLGSGLQPAAPRSPRAGGAGAHRVRDRGGRHPGGRAGNRRTIPRPGSDRSGVPPPPGPAVTTSCGKCR